MHNRVVIQRSMNILSMHDKTVLTIFFCCFCFLFIFLILFSHLQPKSLSGLLDIGFVLSVILLRWSSSEITNLPEEGRMNSIVLLMNLIAFSLGISHNYHQTLK